MTKLHFTRFINNPLSSLSGARKDILYPYLEEFLVYASNRERATA